MTKQEKIGQRYDLIRACLSGGCPEMLPKIDALMNYISTGSGVEELMTAVEKKEYRLAEANKGIADLDVLVSEAEKKLEDLKSKRDEICDVLSRLQNDVEKDTIVVSSILGDVDKAVEDLGIQANRLAALLGTGSGMTYVEVGDCIYRVTGVYKHGAKRILQISETAYVLVDNSNQVKQMTSKNIYRRNLIRDFKVSAQHLMLDLKCRY